MPEGDSGLILRVYDVRRGERDVSVELTYPATREVVFDSVYEPPLGPAIHANVAVRTGDYELVATADGERATHEFAFETMDDLGRNGVCVYLGPDGDLTPATIATSGDLAVPDSVCTHRMIESDTGDGSDSGE